MVKTLSAFLLNMAFAMAAGPATAPATLPALGVDELALLHRLETGTWHDRKAAEAELAARGPDSVSLVQAMLAQTSSPEAQTRLNAVLTLWAEEKLIGPSLITLHLKNAPAKAAYTELFRQASATFGAAPGNLLDTVGPVNIGVDRQPFWVAMQQLQRQTNIGMGRQPAGTWVLSRGNQIPRGPQIIEGQFLIVACSAQQSSIPPNPGDGKIVQFNMAVFPEPKTYVMLGLGAMKMDAATDNHGNALGEPTVAAATFIPLMMIDQGSCIAMLQLGKKNPGDALSSFRGTLSVKIAFHIQHVDIDNVTQAGPQMFDDDGLKVNFVKCIKADSNYQVVMECPAGRPDLVNQLIQDQRARVRLLDANGRELVAAGLSMSLNQQLYTMTYMFNDQDNAHPNGPPLVAKRLLWNLPSDIRTVDLPIDFKNMNVRIEGN